MALARRIARHLKLTRRAAERQPSRTPPFLILFINSICNLACDHCFYWKELNQLDDLTQEELLALAQSLGPIEHLNLSGGEPFLRRDFAEICDGFVRTNGVKRIDCPTSGYFTEKTVTQLARLFVNRELERFTVELSLDGMPPYHNWFRRNEQSFARAMATYAALVELQRSEPRLEIHVVSTVSGESVDEIGRLSTWIFDHCPAIAHHHLALVRGERKRATLAAPDMQRYQALVAYVRRLWSGRAKGREGGVVDPMLHWAKGKTVAAQTQFIPCRAGVLSGVVYANGDVSVCEQHPPLGNLRERTFPEIWNSAAACALRESIARKECFCTNEVFLWPSIAFQPRPLLQAFVGSRAWRAPAPLAAHERVDVGDPNDLRRLPPAAIAWLEDPMRNKVMSGAKPTA